MKSLFSKLEKLIILLTILCLLFLIFIQFTIYEKDYGAYTSKIGKLSFVGEKDSKRGKIILKNLHPNCKEINILLNGEIIDSFEDKDEISLLVHHNDLVEIDGTKHYEKINIKVVGVSSNIETPKLDIIVSTSQSIEILSKVRLK